MNASETSATASGAAWLEGCECGECGRKYFPKRVFCTECGSRDAMRDARIEGLDHSYRAEDVQGSLCGWLRGFAWRCACAGADLRLGRWFA